MNMEEASKESKTDDSSSLEIKPKEPEIPRPEEAPNSDDEVQYGVVARLFRGELCSEITCSMCGGEKLCC